MKMTMHVKCPASCTLRHASHDGPYSLEVTTSNHIQAKTNRIMKSMVLGQGVTFLENFNFTMIFIPPQAIFPFN